MTCKKYLYMLEFCGIIVSVFFYRSKGEQMKELIVEAKKENLDRVIGFVDEILEAYNCPIKTQMQVDVAVEEVFVNISSYAYETDNGKATIRADVSEDPLSVVLTFLDNGVPFDPLKKEDPDITLSINERPIGGLGIFMVKKSMDDVHYEYKDGQNILTIRKEL